jgi:hypothetical protein
MNNIYMHPSCRCYVKRDWRYKLKMFWHRWWWAIALVSLIAGFWLLLGQIIMLLWDLSGLLVKLIP